MAVRSNGGPLSPTRGIPPATDGSGLWSLDPVANCAAFRQPHRRTDPDPYRVAQSEFAAGRVVSINANAPPVGQSFEEWIGGPPLNAAAVGTTLVMPAGPVTMTATYASVGVFANHPPLALPQSRSVGWNTPVASTLMAVDPRWRCGRGLIESRALELGDVPGLDPLSRPGGLAQEGEAGLHRGIVLETADGDSISHLAPTMPLDEFIEDGFQGDAVQGIAGMRNG